MSPDTSLNMAVPPTEKPGKAEIDEAPEFRNEAPPDPDEHLNYEKRKRIVRIGVGEISWLPIWLMVIIG